MDLLSPETLAALQPIVSTADYRKAVLLTNDLKRAMTSLNDESSPLNRRNFIEAETAHQQFVGGLVDQYLVRHDQEQQEIGVADDLFDSRLDAWQYLRDSGWRIGRSQFYEHCKEGRLLVDRKTGKYLRSAVDKYAQLHCRRMDTGEKVSDRRDRLAESKAEIGFEREKVRLEKERHDLAVRRGEYVPRDEVELMIVGRSVALMAHLKAMIQMNADAWIASVEGRQDRAQELIGAIIRSVEEYVSVFARDIEFDVIFEKNAEGGDDSDH